MIRSHMRPNPMDTAGHAAAAKLQALGYGLGATFAGESRVLTLVDVSGGPFHNDRAGVAVTVRVAADAVYVQLLRRSGSEWTLVEAETVTEVSQLKATLLEFMGRYYSVVAQACSPARPARIAA